MVLKGLLDSNFIISLVSHISYTQLAAENEILLDAVTQWILASLWFKYGNLDNCWKASKKARSWKFSMSSMGHNLQPHLITHSVAVMATKNILLCHHCAVSWNCSEWLTFSSTPQKTSFTCPTVNYEEFSATCYADFVKHFWKKRGMFQLLLLKEVGKTFEEVHPTICPL